MTTQGRQIQAGIYCRISDDRTGAGLGVERQRKECVELAAKLGWVVADTFVDNDISAYSGKRRPEYERLLADIAHGRITGLITWHPDRLNRSPLELERLIDVLERNGVLVQSVTAGVIDLNTPSGRAVARTFGAWSRFESEHKSERLRAKKTELALAGFPNGGGVSLYGYADDKVTIIDSEAVVIREMMRRFLRGEPPAVIARSLNERNFRTRAGFKWTPHHLMQLLVKGHLAGWRDKPIRVGTPDPELGAEFLVVGRWPGIVSKRSVERARALFADETIRPGSNRKWLLTRLVRCGYCGTPLVSDHRETEHRRYFCAASNMQGWSCARISITSKIDATVTEQVHMAVADGILKRLRHACVDPLGEAKESDRKVNQDIHQMNRAFADGHITAAELVSRRCQLRFRRRTSRLAVSELESLDLDQLSSRNFAGTWQAMTIRRRRAVVYAFTERITIQPAASRVRPFDPTRVDIRWRA